MSATQPKQINLNKYFDKVYCINLDRRTDRWQESIEEFKKWNITGVERFPAQDGILLQKHHTISLGALGLYKTIIEIIRYAKKMGYKNVLFLEDDIFFREQIQQLDEYMSAVPNDWVMLYLGGHHIQTPVRVSEKIVRNVQVFTTHSFAINSSIYDIILNDLIDLNNLDYQIDLYFSDVIQRYMPTYSFFPNMTGQRPSYSDIESRETDYSDNMDENLNNV
jgi:hypothetical protein